MKMKFFEKAKAASKLSDFRRIHIGCVVVYKNRVISVGWNTTKGNPLQQKRNEKYRFGKDDKDNGCLHAEMLAILHSRPYLKNLDMSKVSIYVYRESRFGEIRMSKPCSACDSYIRELGIKHIYYTVNGGYCHEELK